MRGPDMLHRAALIAFALSAFVHVAGVNGARAAAVAERSQLGQVLAAPIVEGPLVVQDKEKDRAAKGPWPANSPRVPGIYGGPGDFYYSNYYGTSDFVIFTRLPYACGFAGM